MNIIEFTYVVFILKFIGKPDLSNLKNLYI